MPRHFVPALVLAVIIACPAAAQDRSDDERAIRTEIERIFQAFIDKDRASLEATHIENWRGYLAGSRTVLKGRDAYMAAAVGPGAMEPRGQGMVAYRILEYDTVFYGDTAIVSFVAETDTKVGSETRKTKLTLIDVYVKENGKWIQAASQTSFHPDTQLARTSQLRILSDVEKTSLLKSREAVWRAWYGGDRAQLAKLLPEELITLGDSDQFGRREPIIAAAERFTASGGVLKSLKFPRTEFQAYGNTVIIYTTYELETSVKGVTRRETGQATEIFVKRGNDWLNSGWHLAPASPNQ